MEKLERLLPKYTEAKMRYNALYSYLKGLRDSLDMYESQLAEIAANELKQPLSESERKRIWEILEP